MYQIRSKTRSTELYFTLPSLALRITLSGLPTVRQRRNLLQAIFRKISPLFKVLEEEDVQSLEGYICHFNGNRPHPKGRDLWGIRLHQAPKVESPAEILGFKIRTQRLKYGMSQQELAQASGLNRSHLSQIERGRCALRESTLKQIEAVFQARERWPTA